MYQPERRYTTASEYTNDGSWTSRDMEVMQALKQSFYGSKTMRDEGIEMLAWWTANAKFEEGIV